MDRNAILVADFEAARAFPDASNVTVLQGPDGPLQGDDGRCEWVVIGYVYQEAPIYPAYEKMRYSLYCALVPGRSVLTVHQSARLAGFDVAGTRMMELLAGLVLPPVADG